MSQLRDDCKKLAKEHKTKKDPIPKKSDLQLAQTQLGALDENTTKAESNKVNEDVQLEESSGNLQEIKDSQNMHKDEKEVTIISKEEEIQNTPANTEENNNNNPAEEETLD